MYFDPGINIFHMGINGLLPRLSSIMSQVHLKELENMTVGIDAYVWLHRGAYTCSNELCQDIPTSKYVLVDQELT